jgi:hypothetical protein
MPRHSEVRSALHATLGACAAGLAFPLSHVLLPRKKILVQVPKDEKKWVHITDFTRYTKGPDP